MNSPITRSALQNYNKFTRREYHIEQCKNEIKNDLLKLLKYGYQTKMLIDLKYINTYYTITHNEGMYVSAKGQMDVLVDIVRLLFPDCNITVDPSNIYLTVDWS